MLDLNSVNYANRADLTSFSPIRLDVPAQKLCLLQPDVLKQTAGIGIQYYYEFFHHLTVRLTVFSCKFSHMLNHISSHKVLEIRSSADNRSREG